MVAHTRKTSDRGKTASYFNFVQYPRVGRGLISRSGTRTS
jgi:hypothetical protein